MRGRINAPKIVASPLDFVKVKHFLMKQETKCKKRPAYNRLILGPRQRVPFLEFSIYFWQLFSQKCMGKYRTLFRDGLFLHLMVCTIGLRRIT